MGSAWGPDQDGRDRAPITSRAINAQEEHEGLNGIHRVGKGKKQYDTKYYRESGDGPEHHPEQQPDIHQDKARELEHLSETFNKYVHLTFS